MFFRYSNIYLGARETKRKGEILCENNTRQMNGNLCKRERLSVQFFFFWTTHVVFSFESVDEILKCDLSNESY